MPLLGRLKSSSQTSSSPAMTPAAQLVGNQATRQQVCESPLFGVRKQLPFGEVGNPNAQSELSSIPQQITRQQIHYAFTIIDVNKDGMIDLRDLSQMLANLGLPIDEAILSHIMSTVSKRGELSCRPLYRAGHLSSSLFLNSPRQPQASAQFRGEQ